MAGVVFDGDEDGGTIDIKINKNCLYENFAYTLIKRRINKLKIIIFSFYVFYVFFFFSFVCISRHFWMILKGRGWSTFICCSVGLSGASVL